MVPGILLLYKKKSETSKQTILIKKEIFLVKSVILKKIL